jgi:hypothetical protein
MHTRKIAKNPNEGKREFITRSKVSSSHDELVTDQSLEEAGV